MAGYLMRQGQPPQGWRNGLADSVDLMRTTRFKTAAGAGVFLCRRNAARGKGCGRKPVRAQLRHGCQPGRRLGMAWRVQNITRAAEFADGSAVHHGDTAG
jgi:hypothetical protein